MNNLKPKQITPSNINGQVLTTTGGTADWVDVNSLITDGLWTAGTGTNAVVQSGSDGIASGDYSHAQGSLTQATGTTSHAEGKTTKAYGSASHAEGQSTVASGSRSHAEGQFTTASGIASHAEGTNTIAIGPYSHAGGAFTEATGSKSHAGGFTSVASGDTSFIHSTNSLVTGDRSVVLGGQDITGATNDTVYVPILNLDTALANDNVLTQILVRATDGTIKYKDTSSFTDLNVTGGTYDINTGIVEFTNNSGGTFNVSGFTSGMTDSYTTTATTSGNTIQFDNNIQGGNYYNVDLTDMLSGFTSGGLWTAGTGTNAAVLAGSDGIASGVTSVAEGLNTIAGGDYSHAEGGFTTATGLASHAEGAGTSATGLASHGEGGNTLSSGDYAHAEGFATSATTSSAHAEGTQTIASNNDAHAEGLQTTASGGASHAEGTQTTASGGQSHAEGSGTLASGATSHAEGQGTVAGGTYSHAEGWNTVASGIAAHAEGDTTIASGSSSHAEGFSTTASGERSHAGGASSVASGLASFIHSTDSLVTGARSVVLGGTSITGTTDDTVYVPNLNIDTTLANDNVLTQVLVRATDGTVKYKDTSSFTDLNVTGGTYDINTGIVEFSNNVGGTFNVSGFTSGMTDSYTSSATLAGNEIQFDNNIQGGNYYNVDLTPALSGAGIYYGSGTIPTTTVATLTDTLAFTGGSVTIQGASNTSSTDTLLLQDSDGTTTMVVEDGGDVGIGTIAPNSKVHIKGSGTGTTNTLLIENSINTPLLTVKDDGQVWSYGRGGINSSTAFGEGTLNDLTTGIQNTVFGKDVGKSLTSGNKNSLFGWNVGTALTTGSWNTFLGYNIAANSTGANSNTVIGYNMAASLSGNHNVLMGYSSVTSLTSGSRNVMIGKGTGLAITTASDNIFLGNDAGAYETGSNKLFIDNNARTNEATARTNSMIYGEFNSVVASQKLTINAGTFRLSSLTTTPAAGYVLQSTDANGNADWVEVNALITGATGTAKYVQTTGFTGSVPLTITHGLGTEDVTVNLWENSPKIQTDGVVEVVDSNNIKVTMATTATFKVVVIG